MSFELLARLVAVGRPLQQLHTEVYRRTSGTVDPSHQTEPRRSTLIAPYTAEVRARAFLRAEP
ncbi:hypothetical protein B7R21_12905 [Subtercola boreus]|uniref:Uncharacterized protein n=1 Tax=Subtercola boreus TaxID=120213 RepID=A0A3E0VRV3_9MICO|nr:hypothetical protein [Subtercola boreus]RFA11587.1 hypothetical protein B7R21_12905 [Subtercola boreus]